MKKNLFTKWTMAMVTVFSLTNCGEEVIIDSPNGKGTKFSAGISDLSIEGTRTSIDKSRTYYWQFNDQIWVNDGGTWIKSADSELSADNKGANFYFDKLLRDDSYQVVYTGFGSSDATKVTIPASFEVSINSSVNYIGQRGDCGIATATRNSDGTYSFALEHKGSYLGVAPLKLGYLNKNYRWTKVEVMDRTGKPIAGTFGFNAEGIDTTSVTSPSSRFVLSCQNELSSTWLQNYNSDINYTYVVLPPCYRHLLVKYYFVNTDNPTDTLSLTKQLQPRKFIENDVVQFRHGLNAEFYTWDAPVTKPYDVYNASSFNNAAPYTKATKSCATMPNPNELYWYIVNGDARWDNETEWTIDGGASYHTGGIWLKRKQFITGFDSEAGRNGVDMRTTNVFIGPRPYPAQGKPTNTNQYFFLPALGSMSGYDAIGIGTGCAFWSSCSAETTKTMQNEDVAYHFSFDVNGMSIGLRKRRYAAIAGNGSDWFK